jgi:hypothetical protein
MKQLKVFTVFVENAPCRWLVSDKAWKGTSYGIFYNEQYANDYARAVNLGLIKPEQKGNN